MKIFSQGHISPNIFLLWFKNVEKFGQSVAAPTMVGDRLNVVVNFLSVLPQFFSVRLFEISGNLRDDSTSGVSRISCYLLYPVLLLPPVLLTSQPPCVLDAEDGDCTQSSIGMMVQPCFVSGLCLVGLFWLGFMLFPAGSEASQRCLTLATGTTVTSPRGEPTNGRAQPSR